MCYLLLKICQNPNIKLTVTFLGSYYLVDGGYMNGEGFLAPTEVGGTIFKIGPPTDVHLKIAKSCSIISMLKQEMS